MSSSSDHEDEYEVEIILAARVAKKGKGKTWEYNVKWLGYDDPNENTWEPTESFFDREMIEKFWRRVDLGGRDINDLNAFEVKEMFVPRGPPRRKPNVKKPTQPTSTASRVADKPKPTNGKQSKASSSISTPLPRKRIREEPSRTPSPPVKKKKFERSRSSISAAASSKRRSRSIEEQSEVPPSENSEEEMGITATIIEKSLSKDIGKNELKFGRPKSRRVKPLPLLPVKKSKPGRKALLASDSNNEDEETDVPPPVEHDFTLPESSEAMNEQTTAQESPRKPARIMSHRERAKQPRVALLDDVITPAGPGTTVKSRIFRDFNPSKSTEPERRISTSAPRTAEPNASQRINKNKSSVLTFQKGKLLTQKGKYQPEPPRARPKSPIEIDQANAEIEDPDLWGAGEAWEPTGLLGQALGAASDVDATMAAPNDPPRHPSEELRTMAAATAEEGNDLPDFEDDEEQQVQEDLAVVNLEQPQHPEQLGDIPKADELAEEHTENAAAVDTPSTPISKPSFAQNTLFADVSGQPSASVGSFVHRSTIFDNTQSFARSASVSIDSPTYTIYTDSNKSFPVVLDEIASSPNAMGLTLEMVFKQPVSRVPGKFYSGETAMRVLRILRSSGHAARVVPSLDATEEQVEAFNHFLESLQGLRLFIAMAGQSVLAYCLSNTYFASQLNIPSNIASLNETEPARVVVCRVNIEDPNVYAGLIDLAE